MPRRSTEYNLAKALKEDNLNRLESLTALQAKQRRTFPDIVAGIPGTPAEKVLYNYLLRLKVRFQYQYYAPGFDFSAFPEEIYRPDFILPDYNVIIEIYGDFTYVIPRRREADLIKWARNLYAGYSVIERGFITEPEGGGGQGKYVIWWAEEILSNVGFLFARDLPEIFIERRIGGPDPNVLDIARTKALLEAKKAKALLKRMRPKVEAFQRTIRSFRKRLFDFEKLNPYYGQKFETLPEYKPKGAKAKKVKMVPKRPLQI